MAPAATKKTQRIAVVGSGIAGLGSAWLLHRAGHDVVLYEAEAQCGGHTLTDETEAGSPVDLGFQVFNLTNYPNLVELFEQLGVDSVDSDMSFSLSLDSGRTEWASHGLGSFFAQRSNLCSPSFLRMFVDMLRFNTKARGVLADPQYRDMSLGQYLKQHGFSSTFANTYLLPMCAAIWSVPNTSCLDFPVQTVVAFLDNHRMLDLVSRPQWRVVKGRSRVYVEKIVSELPDVRTSTAVSRVVRSGSKVTVHDERGGTEVYDQLVMATHTDVSLKILGDDATDAETAVLGAIPYQDNDIYLHKDAALMPQRKNAWASWNVLGSSGADAAEGETAAPVCVSYWVNSLQACEDGVDRFVTLNPPTPPQADKVIRRLNLSHPSFSFAARNAQERLPSIQGQNNTWFCGAWCGWGFHEDGLKSGIEVAKGLGAPPPWVARPLSPKIPLLHTWAIRTFEKVGQRVITKGSLRLLLPNGCEIVLGQPPKTPSLKPVPGPPMKASSEPVHVKVRVFDTSFFIRAIKDMDVGLGESYMANEFEPDDLTNFILVLTHNIGNIDAAQASLGILNWLGSAGQSLYHLSRSNTIAGSRKNIQEHYDLGNDMYKLFLDETMQYSSGIFKTEQDSLYQSQLNKIDALIAKTKVKKDEHILEVGCGWGAFAIRAATTTGCRVTGVTISTEQFDEATKRVKEAGLSDRISIVFSDYRELEAKYGPGYFDHAVSCEMIEAVGHEHLPGYFKMLNTMIRSGGRVAIQAITIQDQKYAAQLQGCDFIKRHIFPGSVLPSMQVMKGVTHGQTSLRMDQVEDIGLSYATTLKLWHEEWCKGEKVLKSSISPLGVVYDDQFFRKWRFYFSYCEAAFACQYIRNFQISWEKKADAVPEDSAAPVSFSMSFVSVWLFMLSVLSTIVSFLPTRQGTEKRGAWTMAVPVVVLALCATHFVASEPVPAE
jgi:cyclopropane-fatty-acyl-phospholipid synthase